jgi:hypothetical protein
MRVMVIIKANKDSEAGLAPTKETKESFAAMGKFNEELIKAGLVLAMDGLQPSSKGKRIRFSGQQRTVIDGPFTESKELIAGLADIPADVITPEHAARMQAVREELQKKAAKP